MNVQNLPIDIHCPKLLDWLVSRRHCAKDWEVKIQEIRSKINAAIQDMPEHDTIRELLAGAYINYFHCLKIVEVLRETEAESKNMFGRYSSQRMKDWQEIVKLYQVDNLYLAEAAQILQRYVLYEVPGMKKQMAKANQSAEECVKKEADYVKNSAELLKQYKMECEAMGIRGEHVRNELISLSENLGAFFSTIVQQCFELEEAKKLYARFRGFLLGESAPEEELLPMLSYVLQLSENDAVSRTFYEWKTGVRPLQIELPSYSKTAEVEKDEEIDFGDDISFDVNEEIDFGGEIEVCAAGDEVTGIGEVADAVARGDEALTLLEHPQTRQLLLQDLRELQAFLAARLSESSRQHPALFLLSQALNQAQGEHSEGSIRELHNKVSTVVSALLDPSKLHLLNLRASEKYLGDLTNKLSEKKVQSNNFTLRSELMKERNVEFKTEARDLAPKLTALQKRASELQADVCADISKRYDGRQINIMGSSL